MRYQTILTEVRDRICIITINRPDKLNALNKEVFTELEMAVDEVSNQPDILGAIITGAGQKAFVAGADISEFQQFQQAEAEALARRGQKIFFKIENNKKPIIAAVNGFALGGGCELAMACHFRICSDNARFGQPEVNLGLIAGYGGTQRLTQLVGKGKSMEMHLSGQMLNAAEALEWKLVNYVTPQDALLPKAMELLQGIIQKAPVALSHVITTVNAAAQGVGLEGYEMEISAFGACFNTRDMREGTQAFLEKRKAVFTGT